MGVLRLVGGMADREKLESFKVSTDMSPSQKKLALVLCGIILLLGSGIFAVLWSNRSVPVADSKPAPEKSAASKPKEPAKSSLVGDITQAELVKFDNVVVELDPEEKLITGVSKAPGTEIITVATVTLGFAAMPKVSQNEVATSMQKGLANICECSPVIKFQTAAGQKILTANGRKISR